MLGTSEIGRIGTFLHNSKRKSNEVTQNRSSEYVVKARSVDND